MDLKNFEVEGLSIEKLSLYPVKTKPVTGKRHKSLTCSVTGCGKASIEKLTSSVEPKKRTEKHKKVR